MNIYKPPEGSQWGHFNNRVVIENWLTSLEEQFTRNGPDNCTDETSIDLVVKRSWIANLDKIRPSVEGFKSDQVEELRFTKDGIDEIKPANLWFLGGNHRREALTRYLEKLSKQLVEARNKINVLRRGAPGAGESIGEKEDEMAAAKRDEKALEEKINSSSKWSIRLFDRSE